VTAARASIRIGTALLIAAVLPVHSQPLGDTGALIVNPKFKAVYYKALGPKVKERWLARLDGPSPLMKHVSVAGTEYVLASSCKNHDCAENNTVLLYSASKGIVYGKIFENGVSTLIGAPPPAVASELERLWLSEWRSR
jgi:hypothetical protein